VTLTEEGIIDVPGLHSRWVQLRNGARAHYVTAGRSGPPVVLLHGGIPGSSGTAGWRFMAPALGEAGFTVYCPDQPGFGLSDRRPEYHPIHGPYSHIEFLREFVDALCLDTFFLAGNSMGCMNASHFLVRYPERVSRFILIAGPIGDAVEMKLDTSMKVPIGWDGNRETMEAMLQSVVYRKEAITDELLDMRTQTANAQHESWSTWFEAGILGKVDPDIAVALSTRDRLSRLGVPGLCLYGRDDVINPVEDLGYRAEDALTNVQFFYPEQCGHQGQTDRPELFAEVFTEFFRTGRVSRGLADRAGVSTRRPEHAHLVEQLSGSC
jgi:2-hydroxy-6-oxonona-2,4-dienedioate hydrolase